MNSKRSAGVRARSGRTPSIERDVRRRERGAWAGSWRSNCDATLTDLLATLAHCPKARSISIHDRCKAKYEGL
jgi:hypothetical protein